MSQACRDVLRNIDRSAGAHADLLLRRYLHDAAKADGHPIDRRALFGDARNATEAVAGPSAAAAGVYRSAFARRAQWLSTVTHAKCPPFDLRTPPHQRLVIGLGVASPVETGLILHHTYGVPVLPGSALKGLTHHYWRHATKTAGKTADLVADTLFGSTDEAGAISFHDAWIDPESLVKKEEGLLEDVMTPHHGDYYAGSDSREFMPPTDFDDPNPVAFLSIRGRFHFALSCEDGSEDGLGLLERTKMVLVAALAEWGIGGKTSSGYGRLLGDDAIAAPKAAPTIATTKEPLPKRDTIIDVSLLDELTSTKKLRARHAASGMIGSIANSDEVPENLRAPGTRLSVIVSSAGPINANLVFLSPEAKERHDQAKKAPAIETPPRKRPQRR